MDWKPTREAPDAWRMTGDIHAEHGKGDPFAAAIRATRMSMLITDPRQPDNPIIFANDAFLRLTGYQRDEVVGRNCRFLQGPETDPREIDRVRDAIERRENINVDLLNYRKDGTPFWNALYLSPVSNSPAKREFFFASQLDVTERKTAHERATAKRDRFEQAVRDRTVELEAALEARTAVLHEVDHRVEQPADDIVADPDAVAPDLRSGHARFLRTMLERVEALTRFIAGSISLKTSPRSSCRTSSATASGAVRPRPRPHRRQLRTGARVASRHAGSTRRADDKRAGHECARARISAERPGPAPSHRDAPDGERYVLDFADNSM